MRTDLDRVNFAVWFASENLMAGKARELGKVRREIAAFLGMSRRGAKAPGEFGIQVSAVRPPYPHEYSKPQIFELQEAVRDLINSAIDGRGLHPTTISDDQELVADVVRMDTGKRSLRIGASVRSGFLLTLAFLLASHGAPTILKCPECDRAFVRVRRQKYCRAECTDRATWRNYPDAKKRRSRARLYEKHGWTLGARSKEK